MVHEALRFWAKNWRSPAQSFGSGGAPAFERYPLFRLTIRSLLVGLACLLSTNTVAHNFPPLFVSPIWPTNAILLCALVVTPVRHWWAYAIAAFFSSVDNNVRDGATFFQIILFLIA